MPEEIKPDINAAPTQDAQLAAEEILTGDRPAPGIDVEADYEASKAFSVSEIDRTEAGAEAAAAATAPQQEMPQVEETRTVAEPTGDPSDYRDMAKDVNQSPTNAVTSVDDDLLQKALEKGQAGHS